MATRIRLRRVGRKKQAVFRIVVASGVHPRDGRNTETIGKYNPRTHPSFIEIDEKRALYWLRQGAQASESVRALFRKTGIMRKFAEGAEGEELVTIGDGGSKTVFTAEAARGQVATKAPKKAKAAKSKAPAEAKAEAVSADEPVAESGVATAEDEAATEAEAAAPSEAEVSDEAEAAAEPEAEAAAEPETATEPEAPAPAEAESEEAAEEESSEASAEAAAPAETGDGDEEAREDSNDEDVKS